MIATNIEQSQHLLELGLDTQTADMCWCNSHDVDRWFLAPRTENEIRESLADQEQDEVETISAWSLSALLEVMPSFIDYKGQKLRLTIEKAGIWNVFYLGTEHRLNEIWFNGEYGEPVEAAYKMVCWLLEQKILDYDNHEKN